MFDRLELLKLIVNILLIAPIVSMLFYRCFDAIFMFVGSWWLFSFAFAILHYLAVTYYPVEYIANPLLMVAIIGAIITNVSTIILILPEIIKKIK